MSTNTRSRRCRRQAHYHFNVTEECELREICMGYMRGQVRSNLYTPLIALKSSYTYSMDV